MWEIEPRKNSADLLDNDSSDFNYNDLSNIMQRDKKDKVPTGPSIDSDGVPYNYIVIIDAGSKGSRVYVYNYLDTGYLFKNKLLDKKIEGITASGKLPYVHREERWVKKVRPGLSAFQSKVTGRNTEEASEIIGHKYLSKLLKRAKRIVPKDQWSRTPLFLHATAGMRLLEKKDQQTILDATCRYIQKSSSFYVPDCHSHVNIIGGDEEGLYGWLAVNYLSESLVKDGKLHGLLDLGGASTQLTFRPKDDELKDHKKHMMTVKLGTAGQTSPDMQMQVYSKSFLGYGLHEMHIGYQDMLYHEQGKKSPVQDPCMPKDYEKSWKEDGEKFVFQGTSEYDKCQDVVYETFASKDGISGCSPSVQQEVSKCLLDETVPDFSFDYQNFYGVSGYWDTISHLLQLEDSGDKSDDYERYGKVYSYPEIENETSTVCGLGWKELNKYRSADEEELSDLCFKSTYLLNLLHNGLGLDKGDTDSFKVNDQINGFDFSWTLGRAILYASDEGLDEVQTLSKINDPERGGYYRNEDPKGFVRGSEKVGIKSRPDFQANGASGKHASFPEFLLVGCLFALFLAMFWRRNTIIRMFRGLFDRFKRFRHGPYRGLGDIENNATAVQLQDLNTEDNQQEEESDSTAPDPFRIDSDTE